MSKPNLALAYAAKKRKMSSGGLVHDDSKHTDDDIHIDDGFLSAEDGAESPFQAASDDTSDSDEAEVDDKGLLSQVMQKVRKKHRGM